MTHKRPPVAVKVLLALTACWFLVQEINNVTALGLTGVFKSRYGSEVALAVAVGLIAWRAVAVPRERLAWGVIAAASAFWLLGDVLYMALFAKADEVPFPSVSDAGYLLFIPVMIAGLLLLVRARRVPGTSTGWADGAIAGLAAGSVAALFAFDAVLGTISGDTLAIITNLAYPVGDLVLLVSLIGALAAGGWSVDRGLIWLGAGICTFYLADTVYLIEIARDTYALGSWYDAFWGTGFVFFAIAAWQPTGTPVASRERTRVVAVPLVFATLALAILVFDHFNPVNLVSLALATAAMIAVLARVAATFRAHVALLHVSRDEALNDVLTGLGNRRALIRALEQALEVGEPFTLGLYDLDGFKLYNDSFGHPAGDALLARLGHRLAEHAAGHGSAYRMGGDEFCLLLPGDSAVVHAHAAAGADALSDHGEGFTIGCSFGTVYVPLEAHDAADALRVADQRLYARKHSRRGHGDDAKTTLLKVLEESNSELAGHMADVAQLAEAVGRELELSADELEQTRQAAELHDIGKVAVPDAVLLKAGPLEPDEWKLLRAHATIGERIVASAPSLRTVARLIRSSHERWDGGGYPDGLAGEEIPLSARIVSVCDAYSAIVSERPYSPAMTPEQAVAELRRCAGSQFDAVVVGAFCTVLEGVAEPATR